MNNKRPHHPITSRRAPRCGWFLVGVLFASSTLATQPEGKAFGAWLQTQPSAQQNPTETLTEMQSALGANTTHAPFEQQQRELSRTFEFHYEAGKKGEDPLKSYFGSKNLQAARNPSRAGHPVLHDAEQLLKPKHRFAIGADDPLLKQHQVISNLPLETSEKALLSQGQPAESPPPALEPTIVTCKQSVPPSLQTCAKRLVITAVPQEPITKTVTAHFTARCYNLVTFGIHLKTGAISVSQCENPGPVNLSVDNPIGEPEIPEQTTIKLIARHFYGEGGVDFRAGDMNPNAANGFRASFTAFQPKTGRKHDDNKNHVRGARYVWEVTLPRKPLLQERWEGCEDLERQAQENECERVSSEPQGIDEARTIEGYSTPITRPYWGETHSFLCGGDQDIDECQPWRERCEQVHSICSAYRNHRCVELTNTFRCGVSSHLRNHGLALHRGELSFLKDQGEPASGYEPSDFGSAIGHFNALTETAKPLADGLGGVFGDPNNPRVFQGVCRQCRVNLGSFFRDCCKLKGILQGLFGECRAEEKQLAVAAIRNQRCVKIEGRYCHKKTAGICVEKRDSYCCYGSKLARILQEIAHQQLNIPWGEAQNPNCASLSAEQLSRLNFESAYAQQKLSEIVEETQASAQEKFERVQKAVSQLGNVQQKVADLEKKQAETTSQHLKGQKP